MAAEPFDVELTESFGIATGTQSVAENALVTIVLEDGTTGIGEAAPFPAVNGETRGAVLVALESSRNGIVGLDADRWRHVAAAAKECLASTPSALCAVESAVMDAMARQRGMSLWRLFGGAVTHLESDITLVTGSTESTMRAAERASTAGFRRLKVKVGAGAVSDDVERLRAVHAAAPQCDWILDANTAWSLDDVLTLLEGLGPLRSRVTLLEQPGAADDLDTPRQIRARTGLLVAADESARSVADVGALAAAEAADVVNLKVTKTGVTEALEMAAAARAHGLGLMVGGMVETAVTMSLSACMAAGRGDFDFVDLDTPLFMRGAPFEGGYEQQGARLDLRGVPSGHGVRRRGAPNTPDPYRAG